MTLDDRLPQRHRNRMPVGCGGPRWYSQRDITALTGLDGSLVDDLLPRLPLPPDCSHHADDEVYTAESVVRAHLVVQWMHLGIPYRYICAAKRVAMTVAELTEVLHAWLRYRTSSIPDPSPEHGFVSTMVADRRAGRPQEEWDF